MAESIERKEALRKAYGIATGKLREAHQDEFNTYYSEEADKLGHEWSPRPDAKKKAEQQFDQLLAEFPELKDRLSKD